MFRYREPPLPKQAKPITYIIQGECWVCTSHAPHDNRTGHIKIRRGGGNKRVFLHRYIYELEHGPIPDGMVVRHKCDNPACINPDHLELGTVADNNRDARVRGRHRSGRPRGRMNGHNKLTEQQVLEIRHSDLSLRQLAKIYGVSPITIHNIKHRKIWSWLN